VGSGCTATITFTIIEPSSVAMRRTSAVEHAQNRPDIGMRTAIWLGPDTVNFYNIQYREVDVACTATGVYAPFAGVGHDAAPATLSMQTAVVAGRGTRAWATDHVYSGDPGTAAPFAPGHETFNIPYEFRVFGGSFKRFARARQRCRLAADADSLSASKVGAYASIKVSEAP